jgi:TM2 domain-containing membrane protein YozV
MKGQILDYSVAGSRGTITTSDGERYEFAAGEWKAAGSPERGLWVDFQVEGGAATGVYRALGAGAEASGSKDRLAAGLLAILLGGLGVHKFYLGYTGPGLVMLSLGLVNILVNTFGWAVTWLLLFIPNILFGLGGFVLFVIGVVEGIIYLTKTDEEFHQTYVVGRKPWF